MNGLEPVNEMESTGIPEDVNIELPFPMLISSVGDVAIVCKIQKNQFFTLCIVDLFPKTPESAGMPLKKINVQFGATPPNVEVAQHWQNIIQVTAQAFYADFERDRAGRGPKIATPEKPTLAVIKGGMVTQG